MGLFDPILDIIVAKIHRIAKDELAANWLTAIATSVAAILAYCAYCQSLKARKSAAFSTLFAQLLSNHNSVFSNAELKSRNKTTDENNIFDSFFEHCKRLVNGKQSVNPVFPD